MLLGFDFFLSSHSSMTRHCRSSKRWQLSSCSAAAYLAGRDELQGAQRGAHVLDVVLELVESIGNAGLDLRGVLARRRVGGDLVEVRHDGLLSTRKRDVRSVKSFGGARRIFNRVRCGFSKSLVRQASLSPTWLLESNKSNTFSHVVAPSLVLHEKS